MAAVETDAAPTTSNVARSNLRASCKREHHQRVSPAGRSTFAPLDVIIERSFHVYSRDYRATPNELSEIFTYLNGCYGDENVISHLLTHFER